MKIVKDIYLSSFEFWSGAKYLSEQLTLEELDQIGEELEEYNEGQGYEETDINDLFWFEPSYICELIGLEYDDDNGTVEREG